MRHLFRTAVLTIVVALGGCAVYPAPYYGYAGYPGYYGGYYAPPYAFTPEVIVGGGRGWGGGYGFHDGRR
jgi:hypothetical protein